MTTATTMDTLIRTHIEAEMAGDVDGALSVYDDGVVHDVIGWPTGPGEGTAAAKGFYDYLTTNFSNEQMDVVALKHGDGFCVVEHVCTGTVPGEMLGVPGHGKRVSFRMLHVFEFADDRITKEQVWLDGGAIIAQLTA